MNAIQSGGTTGVGSEGYRAHHGPFRPSAVDASSEEDGRGNPVRTTRVPGDNRVHFWIVGKDGMARRGEYTPGFGVTEIVH
jgi:hypothetical protein